MTRRQEILKAARFTLETWIGALVPWSFLGAGLSSCGGALASVQLGMAFWEGLLIAFAGYCALTAIGLVLIMCHDVVHHAFSSLDEGRLTPHGPSQ